MHPNTFYANLFNQAKRDEVFVMMSFDDAFQMRWERVIEPCIREELKLKPVRVDYRESGESIVHDILDGIAHARLVLADITSVPMTDAKGATWAQRNGNVMWELGIAHTMRLPDEVIVVRSDAEQSLFDLTQFRAFWYDPLREIQAKNILRDLCTDRLRSIDQSSSAYVQRCADSLDYLSLRFLMWTMKSGGSSSPDPSSKNPEENNLSDQAAIVRLLEMGAIKLDQYPLEPNEDGTFSDVPLVYTIRYVATPLAKAIIRCLNKKMLSSIAGAS